MVKVLSDIINPKSLERQDITMIRANQVDYIVTKYFERDGKKNTALSQYIDCSTGFVGRGYIPGKSTLDMPTYYETELVEISKYKKDNLDVIVKMKKTDPSRRLVTYCDPKNANRVSRTDEYYMWPYTPDDQDDGCACYSMEFRYNKSGKIAGVLINEEVSSSSYWDKMTDETFYDVFLNDFEPDKICIIEYGFIYDKKNDRISTVIEAECDGLEFFETAPAEMSITHYTYWEDSEKHSKTRYKTGKYPPTMFDMTISIGKKGQSGLSTFWNGRGLISNDVVSIEVLKPNGITRRSVELYPLTGYTPVLIDTEGDAMIIRYIRNELHENGVTVLSHYDEDETSFNITLVDPEP